MPTTEPEVIQVAVGIARNSEGRLLIGERPAGKDYAGQWEFPGGKIEPGETPEAALIRELHEELGIDTAEACLAPLSFVSHTYGSNDDNPEFHLLLMLYVCRRWHGRPKAVEASALKWVRAQNLRDYPMPAADKPLMPALQDLL